jgi:hypothetical protein
MHSMVYLQLTIFLLVVHQRTGVCGLELLLLLLLLHMENHLQARHRRCQQAHRPHQKYAAAPILTNADA